MITYRPVVVLLHLLGIGCALGAVLTFVLAWDVARTAARFRGVTEGLDAGAPATGLPGQLAHLALRAAALRVHAGHEHRTATWLWWCLGLVTTAHLTTWLT